MDSNINLNISYLSKELKLILEIIKYKNNVENLEIIRKSTNEIDWGLFLEHALHHRVYPILYTQIKSIDENLMPPNVVKTLYQYYKRNTFQMLHLSAEMEQVSKLLTDNLIQSLFLKGPILGLDLYGDISNRTSNDLDILVSIHDLQKAEELLMKSGYVIEEDVESILSDWKWRHHHKTYFHPIKKIKIEMHWRLSPGPGKEPKFLELWDRKRISPISKYPVYYLGIEDLFLFLVCHGARHGWSRLRWLTDLDQIIRKEIDCLKLTQLLKKYQAQHLAGQAMILSTQLLNSPLPTGMTALILGKRPRHLAQAAIFYFERMVNLHTNPVPKDVEIYHKRHLFSLKSIQQKFLFIMSFFYPYINDAETFPLPKYLHFLYFPLRPFIWAWRKTRNHALP